MKTERYYRNPATDELIILLENDADDSEAEVTTLPCLGFYEADAQEEEEVEEPIKEKPKRQYKKREKVAGGGVEESSGIGNRRIGRKMKEKVRELLGLGKNSLQISEEIGEDLTFTNEVIDRIKGEDMEFKVKEEEGLAL